MIKILERARNFTSRLGFWWPIILVPIWQEFLFRYLPFRFLWTTSAMDILGPYVIWIGTSLTFALIHWYFGKWFVVYAFVWGLILWWIMTDIGLVGAIFVHALVNLIDLKFGIRNFLTK